MLEDDGFDLGLGDGVGGDGAGFDGSRDGGSDGLFMKIQEMDLGPRQPPRSQRCINAAALYLFWGGSASSPEAEERQLNNIKIKN
ncbi:hypothetical protein Q3G72_024658 [Acer saccharum]|nr:hypothetical protein Q3G72_024658 [Acer saccharum]